MRSASAASLHITLLLFSLFRAIFISLMNVVYNLFVCLYFFLFDSLYDTISDEIRSLDIRSLIIYDIRSMYTFSGFNLSSGYNNHIPCDI